ncbi:MAG: hypothetical protein Fur0019_12680 [Tibeticola sp.]
MVGAPGDVGEAEVEVTQRAADGDVGQAQVDAAAKRLVAQALAHGLERGAHLVELARDPGGAALAFGAAGPGGFEAREDGGIEQAVGQRLPGLDFGTLAPSGRNELAHRREGVEVFDDDARVEHRLAAFHDEAGHLAQRVVVLDAGVGRPHVFGDELVVELLLGHDDAHLAHVGAGEGSDEFHVVGLNDWVRHQGCAPADA